MSNNVVLNPILQGNLRNVSYIRADRKDGCKKRKNKQRSVNYFSNEDRMPMVTFLNQASFMGPLLQHKIDELTPTSLSLHYK